MYTIAYFTKDHKLKLNDLKDAHVDAIASFAESVKGACSFLKMAEESTCDQWLDFSKSEVIIKVMSALRQKSYLVEKLQADGLPVDENPLVNHLSELEGKTLERHGEWRESCSSTRQEIESMAACLTTVFDYELIDAIVEAFSTPLLASLRFDFPINELDSLAVIRKMRDLENRFSTDDENARGVDFVKEDSLMDLAKDCAARAGFDINALPSYLTFDWAATTQKFSEGLETVVVGDTQYYMAP